jgi:hypothetical protein
MNSRIATLLALAVAVAGCAAAPVATEPVPLTPPRDVAGAAVVRRALPDSPTPAVPHVMPPGAAEPAPQAAIMVPPNTLYVCVADVAGVRQQTAIEFAPKVGELCSRHPEMGPCQYERNVCRRSGGRVYAANGVEITMETEAEYDKKVMRVRFKAG